jgi:type IV secretory pathway VirB6-like protein
MSSSSSSLTRVSASSSQRPPFRWRNPVQPTVFRVIVGLGLGLITLLLINLMIPTTLGISAYLVSAVVAVAAYLLAEVLMVVMVAVGPFIGFLYGVYVYFWH